MSNKLEAALGAANSFTDSDGDTYSAHDDKWGAINLQRKSKDSEMIDDIISFFKADALKIIALIAEAAK
jgi:hypothetical protein